MPVAVVASEWPIVDWLPDKLRTLTTWCNCRVWRWSFGSPAPCPPKRRGTGPGILARRSLKAPNRCA